MAAGLFVGTGLSLALTRALRSQLYGVTVTDVPTFLGIAAVLAVAGLGALLVPMRQAMRVDPATVLRSE
jgi:predicted lysophospholipase L1 biosynthesis ABC-type transport system permease subunit